MKRTFKILFSLMALVGLLVAPNSQATAQTDDLKIVTSFYPVYSITKEIVGDTHEVQMIQSQAGIHSFEPSAKDIALIQEADIFVYHSRTLESWAKELKETAKDTLVVEATEGVALKKVPGLENVQVPKGVDEKSFYDPHSWLDPVLVAQEGKNIAEALAKVDSAHAEEFKANAEKLSERAQKMVADYQAKFSQKTTRDFMTEHTAFQYLADILSLKQVGIAGVDDSESTSSQQIVQMTKLIKEKGITVVFKERKSNGKLAQTVADAAGIELAELDPLEADPGNGKSLMDNIQMQFDTLDQYLK